ncbi:MAG: DUF362 domain-containing protein [Bryobacteraceae bacterium]
MQRVAVVSSLSEGLPLDAELTGAQLAAMLRRAVELAPPPLRPWTILKPNIVTHPAPAGVVTDPLLVRELASLIGGRITVAEGAGGWKPAPDDGWSDYAGLELLDLNYAETIEWRRYTLPRAVRECDTFVTLSPLKTNKGAGVSLAMKNQFGIAPGTVYGWPKFGLHALGPIEETIVDLYCFRPPDYAVLGGSWGVEGEADRPLRHNVIVAGANAVAVDMTAARIMGFEPEELAFLRVARARGLWPANIDICGDRLDSAVRPFRRSAQWEATCK